MAKVGKMERWEYFFERIKRKNIGKTTLAQIPLVPLIIRIKLIKNRKMDKSVKREFFFISSFKKELKVLILLKKEEETEDNFDQERFSAKTTKKAGITIKRYKGKECESGKTEKTLNFKLPAV